MERGLACTGVSWSVSGNAVVCSYGHYDHQDWCDHIGLVCLVRSKLRARAHLWVIFYSSPALLCLVGGGGGGGGGHHVLRNKPWRVDRVELKVDKLNFEVLFVANQK